MIAFTSILAALIAATAAASASSLSDEQQMRLQLFATQGDSKLDVQQTQQLIERLKAMYEGASANLDADGSQRARMQELLDACDVAHATRCDADYFMDLTDVNSKYMSFSLNLRPYMSHCRSMQFDRCANELQRQLLDAAATLDTQTRANSDTFLANMERARQFYSPLADLYNYVPREVLTHGALLSIIEHVQDADKIREMSAKASAKANFDAEYAQQITQLCATLRKQVEPAAEVYGLFVYDKQLVGKMAQTVIEWVSKTRVCRDIVLDSALASSTFATLQKACERAGPQDSCESAMFKTRFV